ncbi:MAG: AraC family transcriptional regulator [Acidimicrobiales bacterium]|nr:AraC family transcriptional regulator [Acidimicrobiales bacterium]
MARARRVPQATVTIPADCRDHVVPLSDRRAEPLAGAGVGQVALSTLVSGFVWPGPDPFTHLVLATVAGCGWVRVGDREHELTPGSVAVCPARTPRHQWAEEDWELVTIRLADDDRWRPFHGTGPFVLEGQDRYRFAAPTLGMLGEVPTAVTEVSGASRGRDPMRAFLDRFSAQLGGAPRGLGPGVPTEPFSLLALALRQQLERLLAGPPSGSEEALRLRRLWDDVRQDPGRDWSVEALAARMNVSRATLHRLVARHEEGTPAAIVERIRMEHAAHLLTHGDLPVKAVAAQVGYSTPYAFSAAFRRSRGFPPSHVRRRLDQGPA